MQHSILIAEPLAKEGLSILDKEKSFNLTVSDKVLSEAELTKIIPSYDALIIRSGTSVSTKVINAAKKLKIIARAGVGIDNVDVKTATAKGILVVNAPSGNTISTAEQTWALILALARKISWAHKSILEWNWDRKSFAGIQLNGKTIGIIGLGRIGTEVLNIARAFGMTALGFDPYLSRAKAKLLGVELCSLSDIYKKADVITIHTPLNAHTKNLISTKEIELMKNSALLINCARGGIIVEKDLAIALKANQIRGAAFDTFLEEPPTKSNPLIELPNFLCTPHLGAATKEAQISVAIETSEGIIEFFKRGITRNAINFPSISPDIYAQSKALIQLCEKLGFLIGSLRKGSMKSLDIIFSYDLKEKPIHIMKLALVKGFLEPILSEQVNFINALNIAKERGIYVKESFSAAVQSSQNALVPLSNNSITVEVITEDGSFQTSGTVFLDKELRITSINGYEFDMEPIGEWLILKNKDIPGVVGILGTILGKNDVNIAAMQLGRKAKGEKALTAIRIDEPIKEALTKQIKGLDVIIDIKAISF